MTLPCFTVTFTPLCTGGIAQRLEQPAHNWLVPGSNPGTPNAAFLGFPQGNAGSPTHHVV